MASPGTQAATRTDQGSRGQTKNGKSSGAGTNALTQSAGSGVASQAATLSNIGAGPTGTSAAGSSTSSTGARQPGKSAASSGGTDTPAGTNALLANPQAQVNRQYQVAPTSAGAAALTGDQMGPEAPVGSVEGLLRPPPTRKGGLSDGTIVGYGEDSPASPGQVVSSLGIASSILSGGLPGLAMAGAAGATLDKTNRTLAGRALDDALGDTPGTPVQTRNPIADSSQRRGDVRQTADDPRMLDRASGAATAALLGDGPAAGAGTDAMFSDVALQDRKKPKSDMAGTNLLLRAAA